MQNLVTNTTALEADRLLLKAMVVGFSVSAHELEIAGQQELLRSDVMPARCQNFSFLGEKDHASQRDQLLSALGFEVAGQPEGDPLFVLASLPRGWRKVASEHAMWSYVDDQRGRRRISVFYKATPYDRCAQFTVERWLCVDAYHGPKADQVVVLGGGRPLRHFGTNADIDAAATARIWAMTIFPDYDNELAYWDLSQYTIDTLMGGDHGR